MANDGPYNRDELGRFASGAAGILNSKAATRALHDTKKMQAKIVRIAQYREGLDIIDREGGKIRAMEGLQYREMTRQLSNYVKTGSLKISGR